MDVKDLIARVYPVSDTHGCAKEAITTSQYCVPPPLSDGQPKKVQCGREDREATEPPEEVDATASEYDGRPFIEIRFSKIPRSPHGVVFGCNRKSDVVLPNLPCLSHFHFSLTFDERRQFIVKDLGSLIGTEGKIIIKIHKTVQFEIVAFEHDIDSQSYIDKVERFCQGSATAEGLLDDLNIPLRPDTQFATGAHTPGEGPIYLREMIGQGGFGVVTYYWDVSTGHEIVVKRPRDDMVRMFLRKGVNSAKTEAALADARGKWRREANNMKNLIHPNIVRLLRVIDDPYPQLVLEYIPGGPLVWDNLPKNVLGSSWCSIVVGSLEELYHRRPDSLKRFLLGSMLVLSPERRCSAQGCYERVKELPRRIVGEEACDRIKDVLWREATVVYSSDIDTNEQSTVPLRDVGDVSDDRRSTDTMISIDPSSRDDGARRKFAAAQPPSRQSEARSSLKRPTTKMASQNPKLKRRGRASISQSGFLDAHVDQEAAEAEALLQIFPSSPVC
ncbi:protein kinase [Metarhizium brunneum]